MLYNNPIHRFSVSVLTALLPLSLLMPAVMPVTAQEIAESEPAGKLNPESAAQTVFLLDEEKPYVTPYHYKDNNFFSMSGKQYGNGYSCMGFGENSGIDKGNVTIFNVQGRYSSLNFTTGVIDKGVSNSQYTVSVFCDGRLVYENTQSIGSMPVFHSVNIEGCRQLAISIYSHRWTAMYDGTFGVADLSVTKSAAPMDQNYRDVPKSKKEAYLLDLLDPYDSPYYYSPDKDFQMGGRTYSHGYTCMGYGNYSSSPTFDQGNRTFFNLEGRYQTLRMTLGVAEFPENSTTVTFRVFKDGKLDQEITVYQYDLPVSTVVDVTGCNQLMIAAYDGNSTANYSGTYGLADLILTSTSEIQPVKKISMHRLYNPNSGEHFYTASENEKHFLVQAGWKYEGEGWKAPEASGTPVYRLYNANAGDHHYTLNAQEKDFLVKAGWKDEGIGWYSDDAKTVPLYRQYNPNARTGSHNYTPNEREHNYLISNGWNDEGIAWYGLN